MEEIGIREFKQRANEIVRWVREEQESFFVTYRGKVAAKLVPAVDLLRSRLWLRHPGLGWKSCPGRSAPIGPLRYRRKRPSTSSAENYKCTWLMPVSGSADPSLTTSITNLAIAGWKARSAAVNCWRLQGFCSLRWRGSVSAHRISRTGGAGSRPAGAVA